MNKKIMFLIVLGLLCMVGIDGHGQPTIPKEKIPPNAPADVREQILRLYSQDVKEGVDAIFALREMSDPAAIEL